MARANAVELVGYDALIERMNSLTDKEMRQVDKAVLRQCGNVVLRRYRQNIAANVPGAKRSKRSDVQPLSKSGRISAGKKQLDILIHIMDNFTAKWFELGTKVRYTKTRIRRKKGVTVYVRIKATTGKPAHRGVINKQLNFAKAISATTPEIRQLIDEKLGNAIQKKWDKKNA